MKTLPLLLGLCAMCAEVADARAFANDDAPGGPVIGNNRFVLRFDLVRGSYQALDAKDGTICIHNASWKIGDVS